MSQRASQENYYTVRQFYKEYCNVHTELVDAIGQQIQDRDELATIILNRLIFFYFLSAADLLPKDYFRSRLKKLPSRNYYLEVLIPLFYSIKPEQDTTQSPHTELAFCKHLFSPREDIELDKSGTIRDPYIENEVWITVFDFFDSFQWSIDDSVSDVHVLTPSVIGQLYEKVILSKSQKKTGSYYTPSWVAEYMVSQAILPFLKKKMQNRYGLNNWQSWFDDLLRGTCDNTDKVRFLFVEILTNLKICDNSCGSGIFLLECLSFLHRLYASCLGILLPAEKDGILDLVGLSSHDSVSINHYIISNNLYGVDIQYTAVEITRIRLWLNLISKSNTSQKDPKFPRLTMQFNVADTLLGDVGPRMSDKTRLVYWDTLFPEVFSGSSSGFDIIIGNPPYYRLSILPADYREILELKYEHLSGESNAYSGFVEASLNMVASEGIVSFIIHKNFFNLDSFASLRKYLCEKMTLLTLSDFGKRVFVGVSAETVLLVFRKKEPTDEHCITLEKRVGLTNDFCTIGTITQRRYISEIKEWNYRYIIHLPPSSVEYLKAIRTDSVALSDLCRITRGIETGDNAQFLAEAKRGPSWKPIVRGRDIDRYYLRDHIYIHYIPDQLTGPRDPEMFEQEKLVTQQNSDAPTLYYDSGNYFVLNSATLLRKKDSTLNLRVLLIILNSSLFNWLFRTVMTNWSTLTTNILPTNLGSLPIKIPSDDDFWIHLADYLLFLGSRKEHGSEIEALFNFYDRIADGLVENLYLHSHEKLPGLIQEKILPIVDMKEHQEKLDCIKTTKNKLESHAFDLVFDLH